MRSIKLLLSLTMVAWLLGLSAAFARYNPKLQPKPGNTGEVKFREACLPAKRQIDQDVNNVRARLTTGGDVWWDLADGKYVVPKVEAGQKEVSSIYAGAVWLGGLDPGGNLKLAGLTYGHASASTNEYWPGPLDPIDGSTSKEICNKWDQFFEVSGEEIQEHNRLFQNARDGKGDYTDDMIPLGVKGWPAKRNPYFFEVHQFDLPDTDQGLAGFWDEDGDGFYDPLQGDFPIVEIRGCEELPPQFPDEMIFWIYNDQGGGAIHGQSDATAIRMEVQVQSFAYATNDQVNDMTFQRYKLINRALEDIDSTYFAMWVDADLGCHKDDYIGCDTTRSLAYTYNEDAEDGDPGVTCDAVETYGTRIPIVGIDYFRGPLDEFRNELGMSSFTYFNNTAPGNPDPNTTDPDTGPQFYNYLTGRWKDRTPYTFGGEGYNPGSTLPALNYAFVDDPDDANGWSMCYPVTEPKLPAYDRRTVQASGPFLLKPGAINELIIGAVWVPDIDYPCPDISRLQFADDIAQALFDNCFDITDGPDAPDVDWIELDRELIAVLTNNSTSNNFNEAYEERDLQAPEFAEDTTYNFEGYLLYQLVGPNVSAAEYDDPTKARLIYASDVKNGIAAIYNWTAVENPGHVIDQTQPEFVFTPEVRIQGLDQGVRHTYRITEDQFATGDRRLLNHRKYYFSAKAYAHNNYQQFDPLTFVGQKTAYLEGRRNISIYAPIPRPILDRKLNASYGDGAIITRLDGVGAGGNFLDITDETRQAILNGSFDGTIVYKEGRGPIDVNIFNPLEVKDGEFEITFVDSFMNNNKLDAPTFWTIRNLNSSDPAILSDTSIQRLNEQIFGQYGFTITIAQTTDAGDKSSPTLGGIGAELVYGDNTKPFWFNAITDGFTQSTVPVLSYVFDYIDNTSDYYPLAQLGNGYFVPYQITKCTDPLVDPYPILITPAWRSQCSLVSRPDIELANLNNVDVVFTADKSLWSRCVIVETANKDYENWAVAENGDAVRTDGNRKQFDLRDEPSVSKDDANGDGLPDPDNAVAPPHWEKPGTPLTGMGWFPGYAIDVETGERVNVFFGENSAFHEENGFVDGYQGGKPNGRDMMFNPTDQVLLTGPNFQPPNAMLYFAGGQHFVYVNHEKYDSCAYMRERLDPVLSPQPLRKVNGLKQIAWTALPLVATGTKLLSYAEGLIPNEMTYKLRVDNPYDVYVGTNQFKGYPTYRFKIEGKQAQVLDKADIENALDMINVVPNPYYATSQYEISRLSTVVKITNLPRKCQVTIYSLDGKFIRRYNRDEQPLAPRGDAIPMSQIIPDLEWDLKNSKGIPVSAGIYLIHVKSETPEIPGERTIKWFGIARQYDPTGL